PILSPTLQHTPRPPTRFPYTTLFRSLIESIRAGKPINNGDYMTKSSLMAIMGRMATYTGQEITWEKALNSKQDLSPPQLAFGPLDRKSTRLNSSHDQISYAVFCLRKK